MLLTQRPNFNLAHATVYSAIDSVLLQCRSASEENPQRC